jgi:endonuclease YncB( thermonuclease family)
MNLRRQFLILVAAALLALSIGCTSNSAEVEQLRKESDEMKAAISVVAPTAAHTPTATKTATLIATKTTVSTPTTAAWTVSKIIDGDTVDVRSTTGTEERVRVIGIDTPERGECGFTEASTALSRITLNQQVSLVAGTRDDRDRYNRILRYLDVGSTDAGLKLIEGGFAIAKYDSRDGYGRHDREHVYVAADAANGHLCGVSNPTARPNFSPTVSPIASPVLPIGVRTGLSLLHDPLGPDRNCGDFTRWAQAQDFFEASGGPASDPHRLDGNHEGHACKSLPGAP